MDASPLARLPAELRELILTLVLRQPEGIVFKDVFHSQSSPHLSKHALAVVQTCKALSVDSRDLFWKVNTLKVFADTNDGPAVYLKKAFGLIERYGAGPSHIELITRDTSMDLFRDADPSDDTEEETQQQLIWLRKWSLENPQAHLTVRFAWPFWKPWEPIEELCAISLNSASVVSVREENRMPGRRRDMKRKMTNTLDKWMGTLATVTLDTPCEVSWET